MIFWKSGIADYVVMQRNTSLFIDFIDNRSYNCHCFINIHNPKKQ